MNTDCRSFRRTLERTLESAPAPEQLSSLSWNEHLLGCGDCRALLEAEEALETLLATLPQPHLPPQLARRVLARLRRGAERREDELDRLLELDADARAPEGLARRVRAEARLDMLLERARAVELPAALAARVLAHVAEERQLARRPFLARRSVRLAAAAGLLALLAAWAFWPRARETPEPRGLAGAPGNVDPRLLEHVELLEQWEFLRRNDLDALLSTLPHSDQLLFEMGSEEGLLGG